MSDLRGAALDYAAAGMPVLPLDGKIPRNRGGLTNASTDVMKVAEWWRRWPDANVGIVTGPPSGYVVLDVDGAAGLRSITELEKRHGALRTAQVLTGSGGRHYWFRCPDEPLRNSAGALAEGLDVRGDGGYVAAPPSIHESGNAYKWTRDLEHVTDCPDWLLEDARERRNGMAATVADVIPKGQRDVTLTSLAGTMRRRGMSEAEILAALRVTNEHRCKPPLPERDLERIARSIADKAPASHVGSTNERPARELLMATPIAAVQMRSIKWLEKPLWQASAFQLLAGAKGSGKGTYLAGLASRISRYANVLFISSEDSVEIDLKPRLVAADAKIDRCFCIQQPVQLPDDVRRLKLLADELGGVGLLVIDPVANHVGDRSSNSDTEVRNAIAPLNALAHELGCLLIGVRHPGKDRSRGALASILGSTAWVDTPRAVVMIAVDDEDELVRHIQVVAGNRSLNGSAQAFRIEAVPVEGLAEPITRAVELGESEKSVEDLVGAKSEGKARVASELVQDVVLDALATGEKSREHLDGICFEQLGVLGNTVYKSALEPLKKDGRIKVRKEGFSGGWMWSLTVGCQP